MQPDVLKKLNMGKGLLIALVVLCTVLSFLNYKQGETITRDDYSGEFVETIYTENNASIFAFVLAGIHILLVCKDRFMLQVIPAAIISADMILSVIVVDIQNRLRELIVYVMAPTGQGAVRHWDVTPAGYLYVIAGGLLLAASLFVAWWAKKQKAIAEAEMSQEAVIVQ